ncbi:hypothetical protein AYI69_g6524, partial [Smittium culicis]
MGSEHSDTGIQDPIQEPSPREADSHEPEIHELGRVEKEKSNQWSGLFSASGGEKSANIIRLFFFNDDEFAKNLGPYGPKFLARLHADVTPAAEQEEANQGGERYPNEGSIRAVGEERDRGGSATDTGLLQPTIYDSDENWRPPPRPGSENPQSERRGTEFQDGDPIIHLPHGPPERLPNFSGPTGRLYTHFNIQEVQEIPQIPMEQPDISVQGPSFWAVTHPPDIYEDSTTGYRMGQIQG